MQLPQLQKPESQHTQSHHARVYIVAAKRSAIGAFGGSIAALSPRAIGAPIAKAVISSVGNGFEVDEVIVGNVLGAGHGMNIARQVAIDAGIPASTPAFVVNRVCGSGLQAVMLAAQSIQAGVNQVVLAGGVESMSQAAFASLGTRWGVRMGSSELRDLMVSDGLTDAFSLLHMGITAENIAERMQISRADQDLFAAESQQKAERALARGDFTQEIIGLPIMERGKQIGEFLVDEFVRKGVTAEALAKLKAAFKKDGCVTAANSSGINDGAAFLLVVSESALKKYNLTPLVEIVGYACAGVEPEVMGLGPVEAVKKLEKITGIACADFERVEANEAFAAQALGVQRALGLDAAKINPSGGAIALGHPIGASGARVLVTLLHGLIRDNQRSGLATLCVGGGQGVALAIVRC